MEKTRLDEIILEIEGKVQGVVSSIYQIDDITDCYRSTLVGGGVEREYEDKGKFLTSTAYQIAYSQKEMLEECIRVFYEYLEYAAKEKDVTKVRKFYYEDVKRNLYTALTHCDVKGYQGLAKKFVKICSNKVFATGINDAYLIEQSILKIIHGYAKRGIVNGDKFGEYRQRAVDVIEDVRLGTLGNVAKNRLTVEEMLNAYNKTKVKINGVNYGVENPIKKKELLPENKL